MTSAVHASDRPIVRSKHTCTVLTTEASGVDQSRRWVTERVPGLFESIPTSRVIVLGDLRIETEEIWQSGVQIQGALSDGFKSRVRRRGQEIGVVKSFFESETGELKLTYYSLIGSNGVNVPGVIQVPGVREMIPGRGVPTLLFIQLSHLKRWSPDASRIRSIGTYTISNLQTFVEVLEIPELRPLLLLPATEQSIAHAELILAENMESTQSGRGMRDLMTQAGLCKGRGGYRVSGSHAGRLEQYLHDREVRNVERVHDQFRRAIEQGMSWIPSGFNVFLDLAPCAGR